MPDLLKIVFIFSVSFITAFLILPKLGLIASQTELMLPSIAFSGALIAFLRYNRHLSELFMGDAGSLSIG